MRPYSRNSPLRPTHVYKPPSPLRSPFSNSPSPTHAINHLPLSLLAASDNQASSTEQPFQVLVQRIAKSKAQDNHLTTHPLPNKATERQSRARPNQNPRPLTIPKTLATTTTITEPTHNYTRHLPKAHSKMYPPPPPLPENWTPAITADLVGAWDRGVRDLATLKARLDLLYWLAPDSYGLDFLRAFLRSEGRDL